MLRFALGPAFIILSIGAMASSQIAAPHPRRFIEIYADRGNRRIEAIPLDLSEEQTDRLTSQLAARFFDRTRRLAELDALEDEIRWLETASESGSLSLRIPGLGLFASDTFRRTCRSASPTYTNRSFVPTTLRAHLIARFGLPLLRDRQFAARQETQAQIAAILQPINDDAELPSKATPPGGRIRRLLQAAQTSFALDLLIDCEAPLSKQALIRTPTGLGAHRAPWLSARRRLFEQIDALIESPRTDIGLPLLLSTARIIAIDETLASDRIHLLAPFEEASASNARGLTQSSASVKNEVPEGWRGRRREEAEARWVRALGNVGESSGPLEAQLLEIERAHHALRHLEERTLHDPLRPESRSPSAAEAYVSASRTLLWPSSTPFSAIDQSRRERAKAANSLRRSLAKELQYGLFTRNCVTELSAALDKMLGGEGGADATRLFAGKQGRLSPGEVMQGAFIPEVVALRVETALAKQPRRILPSTRERALDEARRRVGDSLSRVAFESREFISLTSQTYRTNQDDSRFLFFADGPAAMRPLIGLANLGYGVAASLFGLFEAPFDAGVGFRRGVQGIAMSVPELFFFQVRQGSYRVAPPRSLAPSAGSTETR